jgi:uncharacterized membrane protein
MSLLAQAVQRIWQIFPSNDIGREWMASIGKSGRKNYRWVAAAGIVLVAVAVVIAQAGVLDVLFKKNPEEIARSAGVVETAAFVKIPLHALDSGKALFLRHGVGDRQVHYFALKSSDGKYRSAFDACDVCFRMNLGYRQEGDLMVCNNCGQKFSSARIGEVKGGCNPHPLPGKVEGPDLVIGKSDIESGKGYFIGKRS